MTVELTGEGCGGGDDDPRAVASELAGHRNVIDARLTAHTAELIRSGGWQVGGKRSPSEYLIQWVGLSSTTAALVVKVAERRGSFPHLIGLFDDGQLSLEQVAAAVDAPACVDDTDFVNLCRNCTVPKIRRLVRSDLYAGDPDDPHPTPEPAEPRDRVGFRVGRDGRWRLSANLNIDDGRIVEAALTERRDALFAMQHGAGDGEHEQPDQDVSNEHVVTWADALVDVAERSLGAVESRPRRDRYRTWLHIDVTSGTATTTDGWRIPMALTEHLTCDGIVQPVWETDGVPFSIGRAQHIVPARTRRVIERRDRGCRAPGCAAERFVEIHHIVHWLDGGTTDTSNLVSLCPRHHKLHHRGVLGISGNADQIDGIVFTDAEGRVIAGRQPPVIPTGPPPTPANCYRTPVNGRLDWSWLSGWEHPNATKRRLEQLAQHRDALRGRTDTT